MFTPELEEIQTSKSSFILSRLGPPPSTSGRSVPPQLFAQLNAQPKLVCYDWEITNAKLHHWIYLSQTARLAFALAQMTPREPAFAFLPDVSPSLANSATQLTEESPSTFAFIRNSQLGFTGVELHLLAEWVDSPAFPASMHSLLAPGPSRAYLQASKVIAGGRAALATNAPPPVSRR